MVKFTGGVSGRADVPTPLKAQISRAFQARGAITPIIIGAIGSYISYSDL